MTATSEEALVGKIARVVEEVAVRKDAIDDLPPIAWTGCLRSHLLRLIESDRSHSGMDTLVIALLPDL